MPNVPAGLARIRIPGELVSQLRIRILSTHDTDKAMSCGLTRVRFWAKDQQLARDKIRVTSTSEYPGHPAANLLLTDSDQNENPFSLAALKGFRRKLQDIPHPLDIWVVLYTGEFSLGSSLQPHLELCDVVTMWTWQAQDLSYLEKNFAGFEEIVGEKRKVLGLYMWDYGSKNPMPLKAMERQCTLGLRWLREGRIDGMIFLASCICDLKLEAVEWVRQWIVKNGPKQLPVSA